MKIAITYRIEESPEADRQIGRLKQDYPGIKLHKSTQHPPFIHAYMTITKPKNPNDRAGSC